MGAKYNVPKLREKKEKQPGGKGKVMPWGEQPVGKTGIETK